jgi:elongation factor P
MLEYNEIKERKVILMNGEPYEVVSSHVFRKQQRKPVNATKLKNLITGKVMEYSFHQSEKADEAELSKRKVKYLYENRGELWFCEEKDPSKRFKLTKEEAGEMMKFVNPNTLVDLISFEERIMGVEVPIKVSLKVKEAPPAIKGNTATGGTKIVVLETGATVDAPLFVNEGDIISINTETGEYVERVNK